MLYQQIILYIYIYIYIYIVIGIDRSIYICLSTSLLYRIFIIQSSLHFSNWLLTLGYRQLFWYYRILIWSYLKIFITIFFLLIPNGLPCGLLPTFGFFWSLTMLSIVSFRSPGIIIPILEYCLFNKYCFNAWTKNQ